MVRTMSTVNSAKSNIYLTHKRPKVGKYKAYERPKPFNDEENPFKSKKPFKVTERNPGTANPKE